MGLLEKLFGKGPEYSSDQRKGLGYKSDGRTTREKLGKGKQKVLLDATKLLLDNQVDDFTNPYEAERRIDNNVYQMFSDEAGTGLKKQKNR